jgi:hypothetical protein
MSQPLVTLVLVALALVLQWVPIPGLSAEFRELAPDAMSIGSLGVAPLISAFVAVEWAALVVPRWRQLRVTAPGRRKLDRASLMLAALITVSQAFGIGTWLVALEQDASFEAPVANRWIVLASLSGAVAFYALLARLISQRGLGSGLSVLLGTLTLLEVGKQLLRDAEDRPLVLGQIIGLHAIVVLFWAGMLLGYEKISSGVGSLSPLPEQGAARKRCSNAPLLRLPSSGSYPLSFLWWLIALPGTLAAVDLDAELVDRLALPTASPWGQATVLMVTAALAGWFQHQPRHMRTAARALGAGKKHSLDRLTSASKRATLLSALLLTTLLLASEWLGGNELGVDALSLGVIVAVAADLIGEWRGTAASTDFVPAAELHRVYVLTFVAEMLDSEQIPYVVRGLNHRTFGQFFAPFVPMTVLVREADLARTQRLIGEIC